MILPASAFPMMGQVAATTSYLLDLYPNAARAYSSRQLRAAQTNCITVRRASDNTTQTIGFINGFLDTSAILSFCSGSDGFVTTVFDQSGNGQNATQSTFSFRQARICTAGVIDVRGGFAGFGRFDGDDYFDVPSLPISANTAIFSVLYANASGSGARTIVGGMTGSMQSRFDANNTSNVTPNIIRTGQALVLGGVSFTANRNVHLYFDTRTNIFLNNTLNANGAQNLTYTSNINNLGFNGGTGSEFFNDVMHEVIIYNSDIQSVRSAITSNQISYFGVT